MLGIGAPWADGCFGREVLISDFMVKSIVFFRVHIDKARLSSVNPRLLWKQLANPLLQRIVSNSWQSTVAWRLLLSWKIWRSWSLPRKLLKEVSLTTNEATKTALWRAGKVDMTTSFKNARRLLCFFRTGRPFERVLAEPNL